MPAVIQELIAKAFSLASIGNLGLLAIVAVILIAIFLGAAVTAAKDWMKAFLQRYFPRATSGAWPSCWDSLPRPACSYGGSHGSGAARGCRRSSRSFRSS
jgi:hypothetical protein